MSRIVKAVNVVTESEMVKVKTNTYPVVKINEVVQPEFDGSEIDTADMAIEKAKKIAESIIQKSRAEAQLLKDEILAQAEDEKNRILAAAGEQGYQKGYGEGIAESDTIKAEAKELYKQAQSDRETLLDETEPQLIDLMVGIIKNLLTDSFEINKGVIVNLIRQGLKNANTVGDVSVRVSPEDYDNVVKHKDDFLSYTDASSKLEIIKDFSLSASDCIIETPFGNVDCSLDEQFEGLKQNLYYILRNERNEQPKKVE